jgi:hypothetical protein
MELIASLRKCPVPFRQIISCALHVIVPAKDVFSLVKATSLVPVAAYEPPLYECGGLLRRVTNIGVFSVEKWYKYYLA